MNIKKLEKSVLEAKALTFLKETPMRLGDIAVQAGVTKSWLEKFKYKKIPDPSVRRIEAILRVAEVKITLTDGDNTPK